RTESPFPTFIRLPASNKNKFFMALPFCCFWLPDKRMSRAILSKRNKCKSLASLTLTRQAHFPHVSTGLAQETHTVSSREPELPARRRQARCASSAFDIWFAYITLGACLNRP